MDQVMGMARRKVFLWVLGAVSPVLTVVTIIARLVIIIAGVVAAAAGGGESPGGQQRPERLELLSHRLNWALMCRASRAPHLSHCLSGFVSVPGLTAGATEAYKD